MPGPLDILVGPVAGLVGNIIDRIFPDKDAQAQQRAELLLKAQEIDAELAKGQIAINQAEAANTNLFVAGWRPFIGWTCGGAFAYHFVAEPFLMLLISCYRDVCVPPDFNMDTLSTVLMGMLGLGGLRTVEKVKGVGKLPWQS